MSDLLNDEMTKLLNGLLGAHGTVPKTDFMRKWVKRQGSTFAGRSVPALRAKLHHLKRVRVQRQK